MKIKYISNPKWKVEFANDEIDRIEQLVNSAIYLILSDGMRRSTAHVSMNIKLRAHEDDDDITIDYSTKLNIACEDIECIASLMEQNESIK